MNRTTTREPLATQQKSAIATLAQNASRWARIIALTAVAAVLGALVLTPGGGSAGSHAVEAPTAPKPLGESGLMLAAFNGTATITLSYATGQTRVPAALSGATLPISTLSFGATNTVTYGSSGAGAGKPTPSDITLSRTVDQYSPAMMQMLYLGTAPTAVITVQRPVQSGQTSAETLRITLTGAALTSDTESHSATGATENVGMGLVRITVAYTSVTGVTTQWYYDRSTNTTG